MATEKCVACLEPQYCDCLCLTCVVAREIAGQVEVICNKCSHTFILRPQLEGVCPECGESDYAEE